MTDDPELDGRISELEAIAAENRGLDGRRARQLRGAALAKLGDIRSRQGRHDEAARLHGEAASVWWQAEPLKGFALMAWMQQATDLFRLAQFDEALETIEHIIAIDDGFPDFVQLPTMLTAGLSMWLFLVEETRDYERLYNAGEAATSRVQSVDTPQSREVLARALIAKGGRPENCVGG